MSQNIQSHLCIYNIHSETIDTVLSTSQHIEAPNWSRNGKYLLYNSGGLLYNFDLDSRINVKLNTDFADKNNNDHGFSPDGKWLAISHHNVPKEVKKGEDYLYSTIYILDANGGTPRKITKNTPSFWHGWSPDGKELAYVGLRNGEWDIYTISIEGGPEKKLTELASLDDGPDYSIDGKHIYYNSMASGKMELWRMDTQGKNKIQLTEDSYSNWFPHPSPDGKTIVYIAYQEDQGSAHPAMKKVMLRIYNLKNGEIKTLHKFMGGQGSINVPSWSPDGKRFAFVKYAYR